MKRSIIVMAKLPEPGMVKTRLQPFLTPEQSAEVAECLLRDTIEKVKSLGDELIVAYAPPHGRRFFEQFTDHNTFLFEQAGETLGPRIWSAFEFAFAGQTDSCVMIGTDSPMMSTVAVENSFGMLAQDRDIVFGRSRDGGFYLIGINSLSAGLFDAIDWSSEKAYAQTASNATALGLRLGLTADGFDIDTQGDLRRLERELTAAPDHSPRTADWIKRHKKLFLSTEDF
jgi:hypothetical protein